MTPSAPSAEELVATAVDPASTAAARDAAHRALVPVIEAAALRVAACFPPGQVRNDLIDEAPNHVLRRLNQYDPDGGAFAGWLTTLLYNLGCDVRRRRSRRGDPMAAARTGRVGDEGWDDTADLSDRQAARGEQAEATARALRDGFVALRRALDAACWRSAGLDTYAVWLLYLRLRLGSQLLRAVDGEAAPGHVAGCLEGWLGWHDPEKELRFRAAWERLQRCWEAVRPLFDCGAPGAADVVAALAPLSGESPPTPSVWNQWVNRARRDAQARIAPGDWPLFARWVPNRAAVPQEPPP